MTDANNNIQDRSMYAKMTGRTVAGRAATVPPFRPLVTTVNNMVRNVRLAQQQHQQQLQQQQQQQNSLLKPLPVPAFAALPESIAKVAVETPQQTQPQQFPGHNRLPQTQSGAVIAVVAPAAGGRISAPQVPLQSSMMSLNQQPMMSSSALLSQPNQLQQQQQIQKQLQQQQQQQQLMSSLALMSMQQNYQQQQQQQQLPQQMPQQMPQQLQQQLSQQFPQQLQQQLPLAFYQNTMAVSNRRYNVSILNIY